jgi:hypothetical protein
MVVRPAAIFCAFIPVAGFRSQVIGCQECRVESELVDSLTVCCQKALFSVKFEWSAPVFGPCFMRVFHTFYPCLEKGGRCRSLAQDILPQMQPGPYSPDCYVVCNDYNPSADDPQYILTHQYTKTVLCSVTRRYGFCFPIEIRR